MGRTPTGIFHRKPSPPVSGAWADAWTGVSSYSDRGYSVTVAELNAVVRSVEDTLEKTQVVVSKVKCVCCGGIEIQNSRCVWCRNPR